MNPGEQFTSFSVLIIMEAIAFHHPSWETVVSKEVELVLSILRKRIEYNNRIKNYLGGRRDSIGTKEKRKIKKEKQTAWV